MRRALRIPVAAFGLCLLLQGVPARAATIVIVNADAPGEGFNDPTVVAPVGGNPGVTRGAQRLFLFQTAANLWGNILTSNVTIRVSAQFNPLPCDASSAVLGSAGAAALYRNFPNAEFAGTWYPAALADKQANADLTPAGNDISAQFNTTLDGGTCLGGQTWYYGIDGNEPANQVELLPVLLHELGHGLGFAQYGNLTTGAYFNAGPDVYQRFLFDNTVGLHWHEMTNAQRAASAINTGNVVWDGLAVKTRAPLTLGPRTEVRVIQPAGIAGLKQFGTADFGPPAGASTITAQVVLADDAAAPTSDACTPLVNAVAMAGNIALIDRGSCAFSDKAMAAQVAGAVAVIIVNNVAGAAPGLGGSNPSLTIPTVSVSLADGNAIKANLAGGVTVTIGPNAAFLAGADDNGRVLVYAPNPVEAGSSISHWDVNAEPSLLMEPFVTDGLSDEVDLTQYAFEDIGWFSPRTTDSTPTNPIVELGGAVPHPFTITTRIGFTLARAGHADVAIYNVAGREVKHLLSEDLPPGAHVATWDGTDDAGRKVAPGVFFYRLRGPGIDSTKRMVRVTAVGG
jgi:hypothetical protein